MQAWQATVQTEQGNVVFNPSVTVYLEDGVTLAPIFNEDESPKENPFIGSVEGFVQFWAEDGEYVIEGATGSDTTELWYVSLVSPSPPLESGTVKDLPTLISSMGGYDVGDVILTRDEGYSLSVVDSDPDFTTDGGVLLKRVRTDEFAVAVEKSTRGGATEDVMSLWQAPSPRLWTKIERVRPEWGGAKGDGTDWALTTSAIQSAANFCAEEGKVLVLDGEYGISSILTLPDHLRMESKSDSFITPNFNTEAGSQAIVAGIGIVADRISVNIKGLPYIGRAILINGSSEIGSISCLSDSPTSTGDAAIVITGSHSRIGQLIVENWYTGWHVTEAEDVCIDGDSLKGVRAGARFEFCYNVHLKGGRVEMISREVRTLGDLGFIGVGLRGCSISDRTVYDCGEHAFRLGGGGTYDALVAGGMPTEEAREKCRNDGFSLRDCRAVRPLGCGFKSQPNEVVRNNNISVSGFISEDVDNGQGGDANSSGIRLTNTDNVSIVGYQNITNSQSYSGTRGMSVEGCDYIFADGMLGTTRQTGLFITTSIPEGGSRGITDMSYKVRVTGSQGEGVRVNVIDNTNVVRRLTIDAEVINSSATGVVMGTRPDGTNPTTISSMVHLKGYAVGNTPNLDIAPIYTGAGRFRNDMVTI